MSYTKHNFNSGDVLMASQLNEMEDQIARNETAISDIQSSISGMAPVGNGNVSYGMALALRELLECVAYDGDSEYAQAYHRFVSEWGLSGELVSISAVFNGETAPVGTNADDLDITVTGHFSDGSTSVLKGWTITGTVGEGDNIFTIAYGALSTTVTVAGEGRLLPEEYTVCTSVSNNGSSNILCSDIYIRAGKDKFVVDYKLNDGAKNDTMIFGGFTGAGVGRLGVGWYNGYLNYNGANTWVFESDGFTLQTNTRVTVTLDTKNGIVKMLDAEATFETASFTGSKLGIFGYYDQPGNYFEKTTSATLYGFKQYRDDALIADMVPCIRNSDNAPGLYNVVSNTFYGFGGSGMSYEVA